MELNKLTGLITTILVSVIILAISLVIIHGFREVSISSESETITLLNGTAVSLSNTGIRTTTFTLTNSSGDVLDSTNYTLDGAAATVLLDGSLGTLNGTDWTAAYDYGEDLITYTSTNSSITALADIPTWLPLIIIVIIAAILLGLVFGVLENKGEKL